ncbi:hypothetical protein PENSPDRAFT_746168 [Peniophora sp. CONT]|nr:hypothetical protein PENSPDRAFT_746168 [Peniophora sp. CONT]
MSADARRIAAHLLSSDRPAPPLRPKHPYDTALKVDIGGLRDPIPVRAALHLANDDITGAHDLVTDHSGSLTGNYVHAQLHRREGDYWNSKWWLGTGMHTSHPVLDKIHGGPREGKAFVDACEGVGKSKSSGGKLEAKQWEELKATVEYALEHDTR